MYFMSSGHFVVNATIPGFQEFITKTRLFKSIENFTTKDWKFSDENSDTFHISVQNMDCRYSLEPPRRGGSNVYPQSMFLSINKKTKNMYIPVTSVLLYKSGV